MPYDREKLADVQHEIWSSWMRWLFQCSTINEDGSATIPREKVERWQRQMNTPYSELSESEKNSDRIEANKVIAVLGEDAVVKVGQTYRHFKGNVYKVILVQQDWLYELSDGQKCMWVGWFQPAFEFTAASNTRKGETVVFYKSIGGSIYARSLANFTEILSSGDDEYASNYRRFELIEESE